MTTLAATTAPGPISKTVSDTWHQRAATRRKFNRESRAFLQSVVSDLNGEWKGDFKFKRAGFWSWAHWVFNLRSNRIGVAYKVTARTVGARGQKGRSTVARILIGNDDDYYNRPLEIGNIYIDFPKQFGIEESRVSGRDHSSWKSVLKSREQLRKDVMKVFNDSGLRAKLSLG